MGVTTSSLIKLSLLFILVVPASTNYQLKTFNIGTGGDVGNSSNNFSGNFQLGEQGGDNMTSTSYQINPGLIFTQQAYIPGQPTLSNTGNNMYNKLHIVISSGGNPSDTKFAIAISSDNFVTTNWIQSDTSVSSSFSATSDYQTYTQWGGATGFNVIGLTPATTYKIKVKAKEGIYTETAFSPVSAAVATVNPTMSLSLSGTTDNFSANLSTSAVTNTSGVTATIVTNAATGYSLLGKGANQGLKSSHAGNHIITSANSAGQTTLSNGSEGYVLAVTSKTINNAGTAAVGAKFDATGGGTSVGGDLNTAAYQEIAYANSTTSSDAYTFKERSTISGTTPASTDYTDTLTVLASGNF